MYQLGILSRDAAAYARALSHIQLDGLTISYQSDKAVITDTLANLDILLAEPDLAAEVLPHCTNLKWLQSTWAGVKPLMELQHGNYLITGVKDVFGRQMREYVFAYMLHFSRNVSLFEQNKLAGQWTPPSTDSLYGKRLGIMGVGSIGQEVAKAAKAFDMQVIGLTANSRDCSYIDKYYGVENKVEFASELDYLVCLLPHTEATEKLIDAKMLAALPTNCVLINAGRGQVIDDDALLVALNAGQLKAAVLDVFAEEPLPPDHPYWHSDRVHITQHTAAISQVEDITDIFQNNYERFCRNKTLKFQIDVSKGY